MQSRIYTIEEIAESYKEKIWGIDYQKYHENRKMKYNLEILIYCSK